MSDLADRLRDAGADLLDLRGPLVAGEPWPLSGSYGTEPEADWGPREVLAHVNEMLGYWTTQLEGVLAGPFDQAVPFGRIATDDARLRRIGDDRQLPTGELLDAIDAGLVRATTFAAGLSADDLERRGLHPTRGELTVGAAIERFLVTHLVEHVVQLREILARRSAT
ncbi:MAG TPA: DinB family protein [Candidatus Limnocylindrales bacterium]